MSSTLLGNKYNLEQLVGEAINRSISHNEIVTIVPERYGSTVVCDSIFVECEDSVEAEKWTEFWGTDLDGNSWRVHVKNDNNIEFYEHKYKRAALELDSEDWEQVQSTVDIWDGLTDWQKNQHPFDLKTCCDMLAYRDKVADDLLEWEVDVLLSVICGHTMAWGAAVGAAIESMRPLLFEGFQLTRFGHQVGLVLFDRKTKTLNGK